MPLKDGHIGSGGGSYSSSSRAAGQARSGGGTALAALPLPCDHGTLNTTVKLQSTRSSVLPLPLHRIPPFWALLAGASTEGSALSSAATARRLNWSNPLTEVDEVDGPPDGLAVLVQSLAVRRLQPLMTQRHSAAGSSRHVVFEGRALARSGEARWRSPPTPLVRRTPHGIQGPSSHRPSSPSRARQPRVPRRRPCCVSCALFVGGEHASARGGHNPTPSHLAAPRRSNDELGVLAHGCNHSDTTTLAAHGLAARSRQRQRQRSRIGRPPELGRAQRRSRPSNTLPG